ncbi:ATP-binding protein [Absiella sp. AM29-15]|uniref:ATP-binding protein n=1 Tax=Absiella sp. AM29-15 TaxID=2292278 RepID=UPI000E42CD05|nr:ATP-binding protein [Absiella sp. AM29-15]RGC50832.1 cell division protein ZapE [Absiella sp. AM29-15]
MDKISFHYELSEEQKVKKKQLVEKLLAHPYVKEWLKKQQLDEHFVEEHSGKFSDWVKVKEKCEHCEGLMFCRQPQKGAYLDLYVDGFLQNRLTHCAYVIQREEQFAHKKYYRQADMNEEMLLVNIARLDLKKESADYKAVVMSITQNLMDETNDKGVYLWGKPGVGKTYLAAGMTNFYTRRNVPCAFVHVPKLISDLKLMFQDPEGMERKLNMLKRIDVLVLDDIGGESITSWSRDDILLTILEARMQAKKKTIFTSNYSMKDLKERLRVTTNKSSEPIAAERLMERIKALSDEIFVKGETRRF